MRSRLLSVAIVSVTTILTMASCSDDSSGPGGGDDLSMDEAIDIVVEDVLPQETTVGDKYICVRMGRSIPKGATVEEAKPEGWTTSAARSSAVSFAVEEESYLFFLDMDPASMYEHPVKYIVVGKNSGSYEVTEARWWPKVNGTAPSEFLPTVPAEQYVVDDTANLPGPTQDEMTFAVPDLQLVLREGFIVVQGLMPGEKCYSDAVTSYQNVMNFFAAYKNSISRLEGLEEDTADDVFSMIDDMVQDGIGLITIYIIAHGNVDRIGLAGHGVSVSTFTGKMEQHPGTMFNFLLGSCHGGSFIDNLQALGNVRVVMTACASDESAYTDCDSWGGLDDTNPVDSGSEWTSSILWAAYSISLKNEYFSIVEDWAGTYGVPVTCELLYQSHYGAIGENFSMDLFYNLDLSDRAGAATPQLYHQWTRMQ